MGHVLRNCHQGCWLTATIASVPTTAPVVQEDSDEDSDDGNPMVMADDDGSDDDTPVRRTKLEGFEYWLGHDSCVFG
jgi:hypothetical protein